MNGDAFSDDTGGPYAQPSHRDRRAAAIAALLIALGAVAVAPHAPEAAAQGANLVLAFSAASAMTLVLTMALLYTLHRAVGAPSLAVLAATYGGAVVFAFPNAIVMPQWTPLGTRLLASGDAFRWLAIEACLLFAFGTVAFVSAGKRRFTTRYRARASARSASISFVVAATLAIVLTGLLRDSLPTLYDGRGPTAFYSHAVQPALVIAVVGAGTMLVAVTRLSTRVQLWLAVVLVAIVVRVTLGLGNGRTSVGWCASQAGSIVASALFIGALYRQFAQTLRRYSESNERIRALCLVATSRPGAAEQIDALLALAIRELGYTAAALCTLDRAGLTINRRDGDPSYVRGRNLGTDIGQIRRLAAGEMLVEAEQRNRVTALVPLVVDGRVKGALLLATLGTRERWLARTDLTFVTLLGAFTASALSRLEREERLDDLAFTDALTGLANRTALLERIEEGRADLARHGRRFALHYLDLDGFKAINDRYGHAAGDHVLRLVAQRLMQTARATDTVARLGGDEFVVFQRNADENTARSFGGRILEAFGPRFEIDGVRHTVSTSIGVALASDADESGDAILARADAALYRVKKNGRRGVSLAGEYERLADVRRVG